MLNSCEAKHIIEVRNVSKRFNIVLQRTSFIREIMDRFSFWPEKTFLWALKDISFSVEKGEVFVILGPNGSGKTTLVRIIAGILKPTKGEVGVNGQIMPFLQWGFSFHPDLSARENVYLYGTFLGMTEREIKSKFEQIISFAEVENFVDARIRYYSSGMRAKLAFATAIQAQIETFLIDEVLAVGDISFQEKCKDVFMQTRAEGKTIIYVTSNLYDISQFCQRGLLLNEGKQIMVGDIKSVVERYKALSRRETEVGAVRK